MKQKPPTNQPTFCARNGAISFGQPDRVRNARSSGLGGAGRQSAASTTTVSETGRGGGGVGFAAGRGATRAAVSGSMPGIGGAGGIGDGNERTGCSLSETIAGGTLTGTDGTAGLVAAGSHGGGPSGFSTPCANNPHAKARRRCQTSVAGCAPPLRRCCSQSRSNSPISCRCRSSVKSPASSSRCNSNRNSSRFSRSMGA